MFDGNVMGLLGMSGSNDGTGSSSAFSGSLRQRKINRHKAYYKQTIGDDIDPETGEVLNFRPNKNVKNPYSKMAYAKRSYGGFNANRALTKLPDPSKLLNIGIYGLIGYTAYQLYKKFISPVVSSDPADKAEEQNAKAIANTVVNPTASKAKANAAAQQNLAKLGLTVSNVHVNYANNMDDMLTAFNAPEDKIIKTIKTWSNQTAQLVNAAYGLRKLHWYSKEDTMSANIKDVLNDSEQKQISSWLTAMDKV